MYVSDKYIQTNRNVLVCNCLISRMAPHDVIEYYYVAFFIMEIHIVLGKPTHAVVLSTWLFHATVKKQPKKDRRKGHPKICIHIFSPTILCFDIDQVPVLDYNTSSLLFENVYVQYNFPSGYVRPFILSFLRLVLITSVFLSPAGSLFICLLSWWTE